MNQKIFKKYDIRGLIGKEFKPKDAYTIARAFQAHTKAKKVVIGHDMRESSKEIYNYLAKGFQDQGTNVIQIGLCTTPLLNFVIAELHLDGGMMVTASHNPKQYNGIKIMSKRAKQLYLGSGLEKIKELTLKNDFEESKTKGELKTLDPLAAYIQKLNDSSMNYPGLKIVCDYGNGVGAITAKPFFKQKPISAINLYDKPDGNFPNHPANPLEFKNLKDLQKEVIKYSADCGFAFDGDADRCIVIDEKGQIIMPDLILALLAKEELKNEENKDQNYYLDLRMSKIVKQVIQNNDGIPITLRVGNPFYKEKLIEEGGVLAGELSGHIMFAEHYGIDDGLFAAVKVLNILMKKGKHLSELIQPFKKYFQSEEINIKVSDSTKVLKLVENTYKDVIGATVSHLDGIYIKFPNFWISVRESNTEPLIRVRLEAITQELLDEKQEELIDLISLYRVR